MNKDQREGFRAFGGGLEAGITGACVAVLVLLGCVCAPQRESGRDKHKQQQKAATTTGARESERGSERLQIVNPRPLVPELGALVVPFCPF